MKYENPIVDIIDFNNISELSPDCEPKPYPFSIM